jgi:hypothetical protein
MVKLIKAPLKSSRSWNLRIVYRWPNTDLGKGKKELRDCLDSIAVSVTDERRFETLRSI